MACLTDKIHFFLFQRQWYQRWSLNIMGTSRTTLYKVKTKSTTTGVPTKYTTTSQTPAVTHVNSLFKWRVQTAVVKMWGAMCFTHGPELHLASDRNPVFHPQQTFQITNQIQSPNLPSILLGPFEDVQLFQEGDYERMCLSRFRSPRSIAAFCTRSYGFILISLPSASLASLRARLPNLAKSCVW